jgi:SAM-dependent methyltransferase
VFGTAPSDFALEVARLVRPGDYVLDLGCGEGRDSVFFAERGAVVFGVDLSDAGLDKARLLARRRGARVRWVHGPVTGLLPAGPFDLIFSCGSLHYGRAATTPTWCSPTGWCTRRRERSWSTTTRASYARRSWTGRS